MLLATALLLLHPQLAVASPVPDKNAAADTSTTVSVSTTSLDSDLPLGTLPGTYASDPEPTDESSAELPEAPLPMPSVAPPAPTAFIRPATPMTVSVKELRAESRRKELMWRGLIVASSGAATFDAWTTRHTITVDGAQETNPLLKPFAGNASLYVAIQVVPVALDYVGRKMMYSRHPWMRRMWWAPQSASFVASMFCGAHNLAYH